MTKYRLQNHSVHNKVPKHTPGFSGYWLYVPRVRYRQRYTTNCYPTSWVTICLASHTSLAQKIKRTKLQLPKVSTSDLLAHAEVWADHQHAGRSRAGRARVCAAALGGLSAPRRPLVLLLPRVLHGSGHRGSERGPWESTSVWHCGHGIAGSGTTRQHLSLHHNWPGHNKKIWK